jgi:hypothetical protein
MVKIGQIASDITTSLQRGIINVATRTYKNYPEVTDESRDQSRQK